MKEGEETGIPEARKKIDAVIRENIASISNRFERPEALDPNEMVTGWFLVVESQAPTTYEGKETQAYALHVISSDVLADRELTPWTAKGFLHQVLDDPAGYLMDYDHFAEDDDD